MADYRVATRQASFGEQQKKTRRSGFSYFGSVAAWPRPECAVLLLVSFPFTVVHDEDERGNDDDDAEKNGGGDLVCAHAILLMVITRFMFFYGLSHCSPQKAAKTIRSKLSESSNIRN
jgi:hypothetical protein